MADEVAEWCRHYTNCWGLMPKNGELVPIQFCGQPERGKGRYNIFEKDKLTKKEIAIDFLMDKCQWFTPESKFVNTPLYAIYFDHNSHSATCKGLHYSLGRTMTLQGGMESLADFPSVGMSYETLVGRHWADSLATFDAAVADVLSGTKASVAFHKQWAIGAQVGVEVPVIYNRRRVIGVVGPRLIELDTDFKPYRDFLTKITGRAVVAGGI